MGLLPICLISQSEEHCANHIILTLTSVNLGPGCHFTDFGGLDPSIYIYDLFGNILINNEVEDMSQVTGPEDNVPFDVSSNPNCCGGGYSQTLGIFPINDVEFSFQVEIFESDGGCCEGYNGDDSYAQGVIVLNIIDDVIGTIDVGSCVSFNYELEITPIYEYGRMEFVETVCPDFVVEFNNIEYGMDNPQGQDTVWGASANGCDSFINVQLDFYAPISPAIEGDPKICYNETDILALSQEYSFYAWNVGGTGQELVIDGPGIYSVTVTDAVGCTGEDIILVDYHPDFFPTIIGPTEFCSGDSIVISVDGNFESYDWNNGQSATEIIVTEGGQYSVTVVNQEGCEAENVYDINEVALPVPDFSGETFFCFGTSTEITVDGFYAGYEWSNGETGQTITIDEAGTYSVTVNNTLGCKNENVIIVEEREEYIELDTFYVCEPEFTGQEDFSIVAPDGCEGRRVELTLPYADVPDYNLDQFHEIISGTNLDLVLDLNSSENITIDWYDANDELICPDCNEITVAPKETTVYYAVIKYHPECEIREAIDVKVKSDYNIYVPNVLSLSQVTAEANKIFQIYGPDIEFINAFQIYDRWGSLIFDDEGIDAFWDGTKQGAEIANGVYVYYIELSYFDKTTKTLVGDITLID